MKMGLRSVASIINISFDGRPPVSLGTAVVDPLTISPCSSDKMLGSVLCARKVHLFSEQEPDVYSYDKQHTEPLRSSTCACGAPPNMKMGLRSVASIINISFDGRP